MQSEGTKQARPASEMRELCYKALRQYYQSYVHPSVERLTVEARRSGLLLQDVKIRDPEEVGDKEIPILLSLRHLRSLRRWANCCTRLNERSCLASLYRATNGDNWREKRDWCSNKPPGTWYGVDVDGKRRITKLSLSFNQLTGSLPKEWQVASLELLDLRGNRLTGSTPFFWNHLGHPICDDSGGGWSRRMVVAEMPETAANFLIEILEEDE